MSEFFDPPPPPPRPEHGERRMPPWIGPPVGTVPGIVPLELVLARTDRTAVFVTCLRAYPQGFEFDLVAVAASPEGDDEPPDPMLFGPARHRLGRAGGAIADAVLRIGVQFSDGRKATNTGGFAHPRPDFETPPDAPVMHSGGGGGSDRRWHQSQWVWPLPPPGPLALVCQWPAAGIPLSRHEIDAQLILDAAARAQVVLPEGPQQGGAAVTTTLLGSE